MESREWKWRYLNLFLLEPPLLLQSGRVQCLVQNGTSLDSPAFSVRRGFFFVLVPELLPNRDKKKRSIKRPRI